MNTQTVALLLGIVLLSGGFLYEIREIKREMVEIRSDLEGHVVASLYYKQTFDMLRQQFEQAARSQIARTVEDNK